MELNFSRKSVAYEGSHVCENPVIGGAVARGVEESGVDRSVGSCRMKAKRLAVSVRQR